MSNLGKGGNVVDPPRQGWRGGAPMDGFTACQAAMSLLVALLSLPYF